MLINFIKYIPNLEIHPFIVGTHEQYTKHAQRKLAVMYEMNVCILLITNNSTKYNITMLLLLSTWDSINNKLVMTWHFSSNSNEIFLN